MIDQYNRTIDYIRISITDRCDLRCVYCMPGEGVRPLLHEDILSFDEIVRIVRSLTGLGFRKVKITGGEPLARKGCADVIRMIKDVPGIEKVTITTNGMALEKELAGLVDAGLDALNISLDTLDPVLFQKITRREGLDRVLRGIDAALKIPDLPLKINAVPTFQTDRDLLALAAMAKEHKMHVRFIEMMPIGYGKDFPMRSEEEILALLEREYGPCTPCGEKLGYGPCHYYSLEGFQGRIGFISAITHKFCDQCNRVRLTSDGFLKACLQYQTGSDLKAAMRSGCTDEELTELIRDTVYGKPLSHNFTEMKIKEEESKIMAQIGG